MPIAGQVKSLTEDIEASYGARVAAVSDIVKETHQTLGSFHRAHQKMAGDLRDSLSTSERERMKDFAILIRDVKAAVKAIGKDTAETRTKNVKDLKEMAHKLAEFLSSSEKERTQEFSAFFGDIKGVVGAISKDTAKTLSDFRNDHKAMAGDLAAFLDKSESTRLSEFKEMLSSIQTRQREREKEVASLIKKFEEELSEMATELKTFLSDSETRRLEEFRSTLSAIKSKQRAREKDVVELLDAFQKDISETRRHWQNLAKVMATKRAGKPIPGARAEMGVPKAVKVEAEKTFQEGEEKTFQEGLKVGVLAVVQAHPGGIRLTEIGKALNVAYIRVAKPLKQLVVEMRITKRDSEYFPA